MNDEFRRQPIPYAFIRARVRLPWPAFRFGLERGLISSSSAIDLACDWVSEGDPRPETLELAGLGKEAPTLRYVEILAGHESTEPDVSARIWLYLKLDWLYEQRSKVRDPLGEVELLYSDFGYPPTISGFVRYMPSDGSGGEADLYRRWKDFLEAERCAFGTAEHPASLPSD